MNDPAVGARGWRRFDTLGLRLFILMWVTLVASHVVSFRYSLALSGVEPPVPMFPREGLRDGPRDNPPEGPRGPGGPGDPEGPGPGPRDGTFPRPDGLMLERMHALPPFDLPATTIGVDLALRALVIALGAAIGAAWVARPLRRLSHAADDLSHRLARQEPLPRLDEDRGSVEIRRSAAVFNQMAQRLQAQFDARGLHLAAVSHDLRTPLTRLRMRLEGAPPALAEPAAQDIREMVGTIESTLEVLREQRDGSPPAPVQLRPLLEALVDDRADAGQPVSLAPGPACRVRARPVALRRVIDNLVDNALRHGGGAVRLSHEVADDGGAWLHVDDDGPGIPPAQLAAAQQPWVRLGPDAGAGAGGHGLGLAIARDLAERDGARLELANRDGGGLRASLWLPSDAPAADTDVSAPTRSG